MDIIEARRIQNFLSEFDMESEEEGAEDVLYMAAEQRHFFPPAAETLDDFWLYLGKGPGIDLAAAETAGVEKLIYIVEQF